MRRLQLTQLRGLGRCCAAAATCRPLATVVPPPQPGSNVEKMPGGDGDGDSALGRADPRDAAASEKQAAGAGTPLGPGSPPPPPPGSELGDQKNEEEEEEAPPAVIEVGPPLTAQVETVEHDADDPLVAPSEIKQEGTATTTLKGRPNTMAAPELQGGG